jgi:hypothetical protein
MKFLCVACDQPMKLTQAGPPDTGGSLTVVYACPQCDHRIAMLTNPWETEVVTSLGIKIGPSAGAPHAAAAGADRGVAAAGEGAVPGETRAGGCPFSGMVREMEEAVRSAGPAWTAEALARLDNVPDFVRPMARQGVEQFARDRGYGEIDGRVLDEARDRFGM